MVKLSCWPIKISTSYLVSSIAEVHIMSGLARCRPGHAAQPPPYGVQITSWPRLLKYFLLIFEVLESSSSSSSDVVFGGDDSGDSNGRV